MRAYDPLNAPDPDDWQSMGEDERMMLVMEHHREAGVELPNEQVHAVVHVVVENQVALGDEMSAQATLKRLIREGLDWTGMKRFMRLEASSWILCRRFSVTMRRWKRTRGTTRSSGSSRRLNGSRASDSQRIGGFLAFRIQACRLPLSVGPSLE